MEKEIGKVTHFFNKISVVISYPRTWRLVTRFTFTMRRVNDFTQAVTSMRLTTKR